MSNVIPFSYQGQPVRFNTDGWINATEAAGRFGKKPAHWLELDSTKEYIKKLSARMAIGNVGKSDITLVLAKRGRSSDSGTWLHPKLAVKFARWLSIDFEIWCDEQIDALLHGDLNVRQRFDQACRRLDGRRDLASAGGRELARWRWDKPGLEHEVDHWREQMQLVLGLE